ncbi:RNA polymerase sigma factor [Candidatus Phyllobacterium onerii]|uniref:RNA polymerase sigma factor n=1 Tax=Candidatus Phyllobacterium onerii TaxID=3020828 RepID=UPI00232F8B83|nr:RNA polymerase sigma factor [Phyllobacterium sp. IY22]
MNERQMRADLSYYLGQLWRFGIVLSCDNLVAEKLVEQTCMRALEREPVLFCTNRMDCWLFSILHSVWYNSHRFHTFRTGQHNDNLRVRVATRYGGPHESEGAALVAQVMELPDAYRATVFLAYVEEMSYREVSQVLALSVDTVTNSLAAARILLAETTGRFRRNPTEVI